MARSAEYVFVVDDDDDARTTQAQRLAASGFSVRAFGSVEAFLDRRGSRGPACVVLDYHLPGLLKPELQNSLMRDSVLSVVFVTTYADVSTVVRAMKNGAVDFLAKPVDGEQLVASVTRGLERSRRAEEGRRVQNLLLERVGRLTERERQVATHLLRGLINKEIASAIGTTEKTVKVHRSRVMTKLEVGSIAELVRLVEDTGRGQELPSVHPGLPGPVGIVTHPARLDAAKRSRREPPFETRRIHSSGSQPKWRSTC
jgi:FixJ family two-component response regulator